MALERDNYPSFSRLFDDFMNTEYGDWRRQNYSTTDSTLPKANIKEDDKSFEVELAVPGMNKGDFNIKLDNNLLTISSNDGNSQKEGLDKYIRKEFAYRAFTRSFYLPETVDRDKIGASYKNGILNIAIPKKEEAKVQARKTIDIS